MNGRGPSTDARASRGDNATVRYALPITRLLTAREGSVKQDCSARAIASDPRSMRSGWWRDDGLPTLNSEDVCCPWPGSYGRSRRRPSCSTHATVALRIPSYTERAGYCGEACYASLYALRCSFPVACLIRRRLRRPFGQSQRLLRSKSLGGLAGLRLVR